MSRPGSSLRYTFPSGRLQRGHSFGNAMVYGTLDRNSDLLSEPNTAREGLRDALTQKFLLYGWQAALEGFTAEETSFTPFFQSTRLRSGKTAVLKKFILPYENNLLTSAHFAFSAEKAVASLTLTSRAVFPPGTTIAEAEQKGHRYLAIRYADGTVAVIWGSGDISAFSEIRRADGRVELTATLAWVKGREYGLSFAFSGRGFHVPLAAVDESYNPDAGSAESHARRLRVLETETTAAIGRHLDTCRLTTPDPFINDGLDWAKANQLKDYQEYRGGPGFSNNPPSDVLVGRDTFWFLVGANYYAPAWSRRLLDFWFRAGVEPNGKFIEYMHASSDPLYRDDYGLNINDNTPLLIIAAHHYYSLSGDRGFLESVYSTLLRSADYILSQRNSEGLVWCRSREYFVRGLCGWRNCTTNYRLSGAVTEINSECYRALDCAAELAAALGDKPNAARLKAAAEGLHAAVNRHLRSATSRNPFYLLNIDPDGKRVDDLTGDLLFPALFGIASKPIARAILDELFGERFWQGAANGAGGIRTVSSAQKGYLPKADPGTYGLQGGVWPNLALWAARAAASAGRPELIVRALTATRLLSDRPDFDRCNVTPGEFPEYYNGDDLIQRGSPRSTFIHGSYLWAGWEGFLGLTPHAGHLEVNPVLPANWGWTAMSRMPYRGQSLSLLAVKRSKTLYTTVRVRTTWKQVLTTEDKIQQRLAALNS